MIRLMLLVGLSLSGVSPLLGHAKEFDPDLTTWLAVRPPPASERLAYELWTTAANSCGTDWEVYKDGGKVKARFVAYKPPAEAPAFQLPKGKLIWKQIKVEDGWLIVYDAGDAGYQVDWFSRDGTREYGVFTGHIVSFFTLGHTLYAAVGMRLEDDRGAIIKLMKAPRGSQWTATKVMGFPENCRAVTPTKTGDLLVVLPKALTWVSKDWKRKSSHEFPDWDGLYPNSIALSDDEQKVYVGMRQYVAEVTLPGYEVRYLYPDASFLTVLSKGERNTVEERLKRERAVKP